MLCVLVLSFLCVVVIEQTPPSITIRIFTHPRQKKFPSQQQQQQQKVKTEQATIYLYYTLFNIFEVNKLFGSFKKEKKKERSKSKSKIQKKIKKFGLYPRVLRVVQGTTTTTTIIKLLHVSPLKHIRRRYCRCTT